jgi:hypothetical protein
MPMKRSKLPDRAALQHDEPLARAGLGDVWCVTAAFFDAAACSRAAASPQVHGRRLGPSRTMKSSWAARYEGARRAAIAGSSPAARRDSSLGHSRASQNASVPIRCSGSVARSMRLRLHAEVGVHHALGQAMNARCSDSARDLVLAEKMCASSARTTPARASAHAGEPRRLDLHGSCACGRSCRTDAHIYCREDQSERGDASAAFIA